MTIQLSHVAILVPSVRKAASYLGDLGLPIGEEEDWEGEGTREVYVAHGQPNSLLLMEPIKAGAYQRALEKRGPGLHHFAIDVPELEPFIDSLAGSGWLLHPMSLKTIKKTKTAYLARPGFPGLIEVQERVVSVEKPNFVAKISLKMEPKYKELLPFVGLEQIVAIGEPFITTGTRIIPLSMLWA